MAEAGLHMSSRVERMKKGLQRQKVNTGDTLTNVPVLVLFILTIFIPAGQEIGGFLISPNRAFLLLAVLPLTGLLLAGRFGSATPVDWLILMTGLWVIVALVKVHGTARIPFAGITAVETVGGYLVGRALVRNARDYRLVFALVVAAVVFLLPFTVIENLTAKLVIPDFLRDTFGVQSIERNRSAHGRLGLERVYSVFEHPILWGLFCAMTFANLWMLARSRWSLLLTLSVMFYSTFSALSSAPLLGIALQAMLLIWGWMTNGRWKLLLALTVGGYVLLDLASNRTPIEILITSVTFSAHNSWTRLIIFEYGSAAVMRAPIFGLGFNDYPRPSWLTASIDNFWLLNAIRYGLVGLGLMLGAFVWHLWRTARIKIDDRDLNRLRRGHLIGLVGLMMTLVTVHIWGTVAVFVMFYLGAGAWIFERRSEKGTTDNTQDTSTHAKTGALVYSRFAPRNLRNRHVADPQPPAAEISKPEPKRSPLTYARPARSAAQSPEPESPSDEP
ncbi:hypothetical protein GFB49_14005 [Epibacterium sp. SM1979]|uniref:O-antigen ligase n=1 Tax=Tritonibacter litoralis TaxID=2662264 RepID=A0A843YIF1_9RHOB|nr:hypothetical protein [Tritonibacter litoralis]MQQ09578.1 hypothetical protein [Tritonibacter litoralis]